VWTFKARSDWRLHLVNSVNAALPLATWRSKLLVRSRERTARALGLGDLRLSGLTPSGHIGTLMPEKMYFIDDSTASFDGVDLGRPVHFSENPKIGSVTLPVRNVLARGKGMWRIGDKGEFGISNPVPHGLCFAPSDWGLAGSPNEFRSPTTVAPRSLF
jgi:hypothetical protein